MLKLNSQYTPRISNSLAVFAALMLLVSALAGFSDAALTAADSFDQAAEIDAAPTQTFANKTPGEDTRKKNKTFKVSLFLFRTG